MGARAKVRSRSLLVHLRKSKGLNENKDKGAEAVTARVGFSGPVGSAGREGWGEGERENIIRG